MNSEHLPRNHEFLVGKHGERQPVGEKGLVTIVERDDQSRYPIFGRVINLHETDKDLDLDFLESDDNTDAAYGGHAKGTVTFTGDANPSDGEIVTISDGTLSQIYEFDNNATITGDIAVAIGATAAETLANLIAAINASAQALEAEDTTDPILLGGDLTLTITNDNRGVAGNVVITETGANVTVTGMSGGSAPDTFTVRVNGSDVTTIKVPPGGWVVFVVEAATKKFLQFAVQDEESRGQLTLSAWHVDLVRRQRQDVP